MSSRTSRIRIELLRAGAALPEVVLVTAGLLILATTYVRAMEASYARMAVRTELYRMITARTFDVSGPIHRTAAVSLPTPIVGELAVPRIGLSTAVLEGDNAETLQLAVGHLPDTPMPWQAGNSAYAGHRDTFFRALRSIRAGDLIQVATPRGTFDYRVRDLLIVAPRDVWVLEASQAALTLITCYPFTYAGSAPHRLVVQADRAVSVVLVPSPSTSR